MKDYKVIINVLVVTLTLILSSYSANADTEQFVINQSKAVSSMKLRSLQDAWEIIRIDYPKAKPVFMYSSNNVDFCLFDLKKDNKFVVFNSPPFPQVVKLEIDGVDKPKAIQKCFMKLPHGEAINDESVRLFGGVFVIEEGETCELQIGSDTNSGKYLVSISKKIDTIRKKIMPEASEVWSSWEGKAVFTLEPIGHPDK